MPKELRSIRMAEQTSQKIEELIALGYDSTMTGIVTLAVDRMYRDEIEYNGIKLSPRTLRDELENLGKQEIKYVGTVFGTWHGPMDDPDRTQPAKSWIDHLDAMAMDIDIPMIEHPDTGWSTQDGCYYQAGDIWHHSKHHEVEKVFEL